MSEIAVLFKIRVIAVPKGRSSIETQIGSVSKGDMVMELEEIELLKKQMEELQQANNLSLQLETYLRQELDHERHANARLRKELNCSAAEHTHTSETLSIEHPDGKGVPVLKPAFKTIWLSGFLTKGELIEESWVNWLPNRICRRYQNATVYAIRQDGNEVHDNNYLNRPFTVLRCKIRGSGKLAWLPALPPVPNNVNITTFNITEQMLPTKEFPAPDVHISRNAYEMVDRIAKYAPWLMPKSALRLVYPVHYLRRNFDLVDVLLHTDSFLKTIPEARILEFEEKIQRRIVVEKKYQRPVDSDDNKVAATVIPTNETYREFIHTKDNILFYPGRIGFRKGQLLFAQKLDAELVARHNLTVVFAGIKGEEQYANNTFQELEKKGIPYEFVGFLDKSRLMDYFIRAKVNVLLSFEDPGPRVLYEGLYGNTPFVTLPSVSLESRLEPFGRRLRNDEAEDLNQVLEEVLTRDWKNEPVQFAREYLHDSRTMNELCGFMEKTFCLFFEERCTVQVA